MAELLSFLIEHGYTILFVWIALDQLGLPIPCVPLLLAAGALAGLGELNLALIVLTAVAASVPIDLLWFWLGRLRGSRVLHLLCILSLEQDYCVRNTEALFRRLGPFSVLMAKFIPGLATLAPPMSGLTGMSVGLFVALDLIGTLLWVSFFLLIGWLFSSQLEQAALWIAQFGAVAGLALGGLVGLWFASKLVRRYHFVRTLRMRKLTPLELHGRLGDGERLHVLDLRHDYDFRSLPHLLPGAVRVAMEDIDLYVPKIPPDLDVVLCCD